MMTDKLPFSSRQLVSVRGRRPGGFELSALGLLGRALATAALLFFFGAAGRAEAGWGDYVNVRFQYHICYPSTIFTPEDESANGDGRRFSSDDGSSLIVYGSNNALDESPKALADEIATRLAGAAGKTTYSAIRPDLFVVSGTQQDKIFYAKGILRNQQYKIFEIIYPAAQAPRYKRLMEKIVACFGHTKS